MLRTSCGQVLQLTFGRGLLSIAMTGAGPVEQRSGRLKRQLGGVEIGKPIGKDDVVGRHRAAGETAEAPHEIGRGRRRLGAPLEQADIGLGAAEPGRKLFLRKPFLSPPSRQSHSRNILAAGASCAVLPLYCQRLYFRASYKEQGGDEYNRMPYCVLVMRPGNRLRELRKAAKLTQTEMAEQTGVSQSAISQLENGEVALNVPWMRSFARVLKCAPADLLDPEDNPDRLEAEERAWVDLYRQADERERVQLKRVGEAVLGYRGPDAEVA